MAINQILFQIITLLLCHVNCSFLTQFFFFLNLSVTCWLAVGRLSVTCRPTVDRQSADRFFGELFFTITQIFATHQDQNASFLPKLYTTSQLKQRLENTHYLPMLPSYLASQPGGKGWFCHGWNCVQAFAIFDFTSDKNKNNASAESCDSTSNNPCNASELLSENCSHLGTLDNYPFIFFSPIEAIVYLLWRT